MVITDSGKPVVDGEWIRARLGKLTASRMKDALDFKKNGEEGEARRRYKMELIAERMTDIVVPHHVNSAMEWGLEKEPEAKHHYVLATGHQIQQGAFVDHPEIEYCGCTPDAFVDPDGLLETKCPTTVTHLKWMLAGTVPVKHQPQMALQMMCTGRVWCDFCSYDPRMPEGKRLFIRRYEPTADELKVIERAAIRFLDEVEALFRAVTEG